VVTNEITVTSGSAIVIKAHERHLDLNGRTLSSPAGADVIQISEIAASRGVVVRHGRLVGGSERDSFGGINRVALRVEDVEVDNVVNMGIYVEAASRWISSDVAFHDAGHSGIYVPRLDGAFDGRVSATSSRGGSTRTASPSMAWRAER